MSDATTETTDAPADIAEPTEQAPETAPADTPDAGGDDLHDLDKAREIRRENKTLRARAKAAELELERLRGVADQFHTDQIAKLAGDRIADVRDLLDRTPLTELVGDDGVDAERVTAAIDDLLADRPHLSGRKRMAPNPAQSRLQGSGGMGGTTWKEALSGG